MPNIKSAAKRNRTALKNRTANRATKSLIRLLRKQLDEALAGGDREQCAVLQRRYTSVVDKAVKRGIIKANNADRRKARIARLLKPAAPAGQTA